jgi:hypothetical protein
MSDIDCDYTDDPVCPHCSNLYSDAWEISFNAIETAEVECESCEKSFKVTRHTSVNYSTEKGASP